ncbi:hypothetical protein ASPTUDRAFT_47698 [Aspergillus tubingensis CBS 134.48]|uniref:Uncharacterized protein n=1 Tax=Aspergillus tubingensis (strain CBS 134.48) TaxID=767770 RepID=A0A1L9MU70_ASPTC|nr:hypothetical protein ASPTUDRAFT_47698 [Aspergillus tubingensis CBS 134.48]
MKWFALKVGYPFILEGPVSSLATKNESNGLEVIQTLLPSEDETSEQDDWFKL